MYYGIYLKLLQCLFYGLYVAPYTIVKAFPLQIDLDGMEVFQLVWRSDSFGGLPSSSPTILRNDLYLFSPQYPPTFQFQVSTRSSFHINCCVSVPRKKKKGRMQNKKRKKKILPIACSERYIVLVPNTYHNSPKITISLFQNNNSVCDVYL